jgi:hypothetical protein
MLDDEDVGRDLIMTLGLIIIVVGVAVIVTVHWFTLG